MSRFSSSIVSKLKKCFFMLAVIRLMPGPVKADFTMTAVFDGENGSMGFENGRSYTLTIDYDTSAEWFVARAASGPHCPYSGVESFLSNWLPIASVLRLYQ